jgi:hypothetical protein
VVVYFGVDGYSKTNNRQADVQRLIDSHVIGLIVDENIQYDSEKRQKKKLDWQENESSGDSEKIQNYIMVEAYPEYTAHRIFVHGKELFPTEDLANNFFTQKEKTEAFFNPNIVERIAKTFLPNVFEQRISAFPLSESQVNDIDLKSLMIDYPHIDFSSFADLKINEETIFPLLDLLNKNGVNLAEELNKYRSNHGHSSRDLLIKEIICSELPLRMENFLQEEGNVIEKATKNRWAIELKSYAAAHNYDWEILNNFKSALTIDNANYDSLEELLYAGAKKRAEAILLDQSKGLRNPYKEPFTQVESSMGRIMVDSVQPNILHWILEKKMPIVIVDDFNIDSIFYTGDRQGGKYHKSSGPDFDDVVYCSDRSLSHNGLSWLINHEIAHALDHQTGQKDFGYSFQNALPDMIKQDGVHLEKLIDWVRAVDSSAPPEQLDILNTIGRMRGLDGNARGNFETLKKTVINALEDVKVWSLTTFNSGEQNIYYPNQTAQHIEVPAVISHLKGQYQDNLISLALPILSNAVKIDQAIKLNNHKDKNRTAKLEEVAEQLKKSIADFSTNQEKLNTQKISALLKKKSGLQI